MTKINGLSPQVRAVYFAGALAALERIREHLAREMQQIDTHLNEAKAETRPAEKKS